MAQHLSPDRRRLLTLSVAGAVAIAIAVAVVVRIQSSDGAQECDSKPGDVTDIAHEPDWRPHADYRPWTDRAGCLLRIDVVAERPGPEHCDWEDATVLIVGKPLGTRYTSPSDTTEFIRDPDAVFGHPDLTAAFDSDATVPDDAVDTGYRRGDRALWHKPDDPSAIWVVSSDVVEQWPAGVAPICR